MFEIAQTSAVETTGGTGAKTQPAWALSQKSLAKVKKHVEDQFFKNNTPQQGRDLILQIIENEVPSVFRILSEPVYAASFCCMTQSS
jgi:hypothetical protein